MMEHTVEDMFVADTAVAMVAVVVDVVVAVVAAAAVVVVVFALLLMLLIPRCKKECYEKIFNLRIINNT
jgi:Flp pilus assembly protein TadB